MHRHGPLTKLNEVQFVCWLPLSEIDALLWASGVRTRVGRSEVLGAHCFTSRVLNIAATSGKFDLGVPVDRRWRKLHDFRISFSTGRVTPRSQASSKTLAQRAPVSAFFRYSCGVLHITPPIRVFLGHESGSGIFHRIRWSRAKSHILRYPERYVCRAFLLFPIRVLRTIRAFIPMYLGLGALSLHDWGPRLPNFS